MATVHLSSALRKWACGKARIEIPGETLAEVLERLESLFPDLKDRLVSRSGRIAAYVRICVNGDDVAHRHGLDTELGPRCEVTVLVAMSGG